jgi:hypothetical protein
MDSIKIDAGVKRIAINDDPNRVIIFNPTDVAFAERFYALIGDLEVKQVEYQERAEALDLETEVDENGMPANTPAGMAFSREVCEHIHGKIDDLFGEGSSQIIFEGMLSIDMIHQFFEGLLPFFQSVREERLAKYQRPPQSKKGKRVMK